MVYVVFKGDRFGLPKTVFQQAGQLLRRCYWRHYDFVPPGLTRLPEEFEELFPTVRKGRPFNPKVPHTGRWDRHFPEVGLCTMEEATILYNYGLQFRGKEALEIGSWVGWSTVALGLAGVRLTVVDPLLEGSLQTRARALNLARSGLSDLVEQVVGRSPEAVRVLMDQGRRWSLFFIDGDHVGAAPLSDAQICSAAARNTAVIVLHDAVQENVCGALTWLAEHGWNCGIHRTAQLLAVAWRGGALPVRHRPDPAVKWESLLRWQWPYCTRFRVI